MNAPSTSARRLVRRTDDRLVAGVCGGVADYFGIDPVIVRVVAVVLTIFGGAGVVAYGAAWLLIPADDESESVGERVVRRHEWTRIAGIALVVVALTSLSGPWWHSGFFGGHVVSALVLIGLGVWLLSRTGAGHDHDDNPPRTSHETGIMDPGPAPTTTASAETRATPERRGRRRGRRGGGLAAATFGVLLVGAGAVGLWLASGRSVEPTTVFACGLVVVGIALVVSTWWGRPWFLIPLGLVMLVGLSASAFIDVPITGGVGQHDVQPATVAAIGDEYHLGMGELRIDFTDVDEFRGASSETAAPVHVHATVGVGHLLVILPRNTDVTVHARAGMGHLQLLDQSDGGIRIDKTEHFTARPSAARLDLDLEVGAGEVEVRDAAA